MIEAMLLIFAGFLDRVRGGYPQPHGDWHKWVSHGCVMLAYVIMVSIVSTNPYILGAAAIFGEFAWRHDNGWRGNWIRRDKDPMPYGLMHWWQPLRWGALWSAPLLLVAYWEPMVLWFFVAMPIAALLSVEIGRLLPGIPILGLNKPDKDAQAWAWSEFIELPIGGILLYLLL